MRARWFFVVSSLLVGACDEMGENLSGVPGYLISAVRVSPSVDTIFVTDSIRATDRITFAATATGRNGGALPSMTFAWSTSDTSIATIDEQGVVTPKTFGVVDIIASADKIGTATLVILPATLAVTVAPTTDTILVRLPIVPERDTIRLRASATDLNGALLGGVTLSWMSSAPSIATVDQSGLVHAQGIGTTFITVSANGHNAAALVHVLAAASRSGG
jgi:uncharacterized protein YjdB